jgi:hypothetical protein
MASDLRTEDWDSWIDAFATFCQAQASDPRVFARLVGRTTSADHLKPTIAGLAAKGSPPDALAGKGETMDIETMLALQGRDFVAHAYATLLRRPADSAGLEFYLGQLRDGVDKLEVLRALATSAEGRARYVELPGLEERIASRGSALRRVLRRWRGT